MAKNRGLGRGFDALIPTRLDDTQQPAAAADGDAVKQIRPDDIRPNPHQPRQLFEEEALGELAASLKQHGILQPLVVTSAGNDKYELIAGERRLRAAKLAGLKTVPAVVRSFDEQQKLELALIENLQRADLNPIETAIAYRKLVDEFNLSPDQVAQRVGQARSTVSNTMRLLALPPEASRAVAEGRISEGHARAILSAEPGKRQELLELIIKNHWTVRQAEEFTRAYTKPQGSKEQGLKRIAGSNDLTKALESYLGAKVTMQPTARGGKLIIAYTSDDELQRIIATIKPEAG